MSEHSRLLKVLTVLSLTALVGCGGKANVTGTVTLDGEPVPSGAITFINADGNVREGSVITNGAFRVSVPPGKYKLELTGSKVTGRRTQKGFDGKDEVVETTGELFPARYNTNSDLFEEIKSGSQPLKLDLKSK
jgi:hypothetical protein